jgi:hypothetical protein
MKEDAADEMRLSDKAQAAQHCCCGRGASGQCLGMSPLPIMARIMTVEQQCPFGGGADSARVGQMIAIRARQT